MNEISDAAKALRAKRKDHTTNPFKDPEKASKASKKRWSHAKSKDRPSRPDVFPMDTES